MPIAGLGGLVASLAVGSGMGLWFVALVDWVRCRSEGFADAHEARVCATAARSPWQVPWAALRPDAPGRRYALSAVLLGAAAWALAWGSFWSAHGSVARWAFDVAYLSILLFFALLDARWRVLPVEPMVGAAILLAAGRVALGASVPSTLVGAAALWVFFGAQSWLSRGRWLGSGDPLLALLIGAALGWPRAASAAYATYLAVVPLLAFQLARAGTVRRVRWPFGPLLAIGGTVAWAYGDALWAWLAGAR